MFIHNFSSNSVDYNQTTTRGKKWPPSWRQYWDHCETNGVVWFDQYSLLKISGLPLRIPRPLPVVPAPIYTNRQKQRLVPASNITLCRYISRVVALQWRTSLYELRLTRATKDHRSISRAGFNLGKALFGKYVGPLPALIPLPDCLRTQSCRLP